MHVVACSNIERNRVRAPRLCLAVTAQACIREPIADAGKNRRVLHEDHFTALQRVRRTGRADRAARVGPQGIRIRGMHIEVAAARVRRDVVGGRTGVRLATELQPIVRLRRMIDASIQRSPLRARHV